MNTYYISYGSKTMMYTLRQRYDRDAYTSEGVINVTVDVYVRNLSTDPVKAVEKAREYIEVNDCTAEFSESELPALDEIRRRESTAIQAAREALEAEYACERIAREQKLFEMIDAGIWPFGRHVNDMISNAPRDYALYWIKRESSLTEENRLEAFLVAKVKEAFPELANIPKPNDKYFGEVGKRLDITATVTDKFFFESYYGYRSCSTAVVKMVSETGELIVYSGTGDVTQFKVGNTVTFKATIKDHDVYKNEKQTKVARIKV